MPREALVSREHEGNGPSEFDSSMDAETNTHRCDLARARKARASRPRGQKKHPCCAAPRGKVKHNTRIGGSALEVRAVCVSKERGSILYRFLTEPVVVAPAAVASAAVAQDGTPSCSRSWTSPTQEAGSRASVSTATRKRNTLHRCSRQGSRRRSTMRSTLARRQGGRLSVDGPGARAVTESIYSVCVLVAPRQ